MNNYFNAPNAATAAEWAYRDSRHSALCRLTGKAERFAARLAAHGMDPDDARQAADDKFSGYVNDIEEEARIAGREAAQDWADRHK